MKRTETKRKCEFEGCKNPCKAKNKDRFCSFHATKATINRFLGKLYTHMSQRIKGNCTNTPLLYLGKPILPKDVFMSWAKNHSDFLNLYKQYAMSSFNRKLAPSINRTDSNKGYTLDNMEWMSSSQNSTLAGSVRKMKNKERKAIYEVLGVK